jgi:hypothetical protein
MSGRIKLLRDGVPISDDDEPPIPYSYDEPGDFDMTCGTYGLDDYQLPNSECQSQFVCGADEAARESIQQSAPCYDAFNCAMMAGMTTGAQSGSEIALFIHQYVHRRRDSFVVIVLLALVTLVNARHTHFVTPAVDKHDPPPPERRQHGQDSA